MKLNGFCEGNSFRTGSTERRGKASTGSPPDPLNPRVQNALSASATRHQRSFSEVKPATGIEGGRPWGLFAAFAAVLASTAFLFVIASTGGLDLG